LRRTATNAGDDAWLGHFLYRIPMPAVGSQAELVNG
jgi:hypothetical protein